MEMHIEAGWPASILQRICCSFLVSVLMVDDYYDANMMSLAIEKIFLDCF